MIPGQKHQAPGSQLICGIATETQANKGLFHFRILRYKEEPTEFPKMFRAQHLQIAVRF